MSYFHVFKSSLSVNIIRTIFVINFIQNVTKSSFINNYFYSLLLIFLLILSFQLIFHYHMNGPGFSETLNNPNPGELRVVMRLPSRAITIWQHSADEGDKWNLANVYIGEFDLKLSELKTLKICRYKEIILMIKYFIIT